jgi:hypothetical protein
MCEYTHSLLVFMQSLDWTVPDIVVATTVAQTVVESMLCVENVDGSQWS